MPTGGEGKFDTPQLMTFTVPPPEDVTVTQSTEVSGQTMRAKVPFIRYIDVIRWKAPKHGDDEVVAFQLINRKNNRVLYEVPNRQGRRHFKIKIKTDNPSKIFKYAMVSVGENGQTSVPVRAKITKSK